MSEIGISLGSGGARGWCHIGVLNALDDLGLAPVRVAGCSMGALVGAAWAGGRLDALEDWARNLTQTTFLSYVDMRFHEGGLVRGSYVRDILKEIGLPDRIEDLERPFVAVATDMATGQEVWFDRGNLFDAVRASISIPGVFSPHPVGGKWLLDGGMVNPIPNSALKSLGKGAVISVNPNGKHADLWSPKSWDPVQDLLEAAPFKIELPDLLRRNLPEARVQGPGYFDVVSTSIDIMTEFVRDRRAKEDPADVVLSADLNEISVLELFRADEAIAEGERLVRDNAKALSRLLV